MSLLGPRVLFCLLFFFCTDAMASALKPRQYGADRRFKAWTYYPNTVYYFAGHYLNHTYIEFEEGETISNMSTPKPTAWQLVPSSNRLFLKPVEDDADTTLTLMTNKRVYFFELHAEEARNPFDDELTFFIKFRYPKSSSGGAGADDDGNFIIQQATSPLPDLSRPEKYNFNYTVSGSSVITPEKMFDDGQFTYLQFRPSSPMPAVFTVDSDGFEEVANFRVAGDYIIVEKTAAMFSLKRGPDVVCVFNEAMGGGRPKK